MHRVEGGIERFGAVYDIYKSYISPVRHIQFSHSLLHHAFSPRLERRREDITMPRLFNLVNLNLMRLFHLSYPPNSLSLDNLLQP